MHVDIFDSDSQTESQNFIFQCNNKLCVNEKEFVMDDLIALVKKIREVKDLDGIKDAQE